MMATSTPWGGNDPCAAARMLRDAYYRLVSGTAEMEVEYRANDGVTRRLVYARADRDALRREMERFEALCAAESGIAAPRMSRTQVIRSTKSTQF